MYTTMSRGDTERNVLNYYNLQSTNPLEWPKELDDTDDEDEDDQRKVTIRRSRSRYSALERAASDRRTLLPGSQQTRDGRANLVQKDEADPLGGSGSVVAMLRQRGLPVEQDTRLRNKFLLSSTTFSPALFLSQAHSDATTDDLIQGMENLLRSIDQKSASLKVLVETNFERFVRAKATIDNVYMEMRNQGVEQPETKSPPSPKGTRHNRQVSRNSMVHQRLASVGNTITPSKLSKNALRRETDYGTKGVKEPLLEIAQRAEDVWGPALGGREREANLKAVAEEVETNRQLYELGAELDSAIQQRSYERIVELYRSARSFVSQTTSIAQRASSTGQPLSQRQVHTILVTGRMWIDVQEQITTLKQVLWRSLGSLQDSGRDQGQRNTDAHMELISILLELGVEDSPIQVWLFSRYDHLKNKIAAVTQRSKIEIEILRRRLAAADPLQPHEAASYLRSATTEASGQHDTEQVVEFWTTVTSYVNKLVSLTDGLLGEVANFWSTSKSFIDGTRQRTLPAGYNDESRKHHRLSEAGVHDLAKGVVELVESIRASLHSLFVEPPTEDISSLYTPATALTARTPQFPLFSPSEGRVGSIDERSAPSTVPSRGELWNNYAFWPPRSNALSAVHHVEKMLTALARGASEMSSLEPVARDGRLMEGLKNVISAAREGCIVAICAAWGVDCSGSMYLEDWVRSQDRRDLTRLASYFTAYERAVVLGIQRILYLTDAVRASSRTLVVPPSSNSTTNIRQHFVDSVTLFATGLLSSVRQSKATGDDEWILISQPLPVAATDSQTAQPASQVIDTSGHSTRTLLTLSNIKYLRGSEVTSLVNLFETSFTSRLVDEAKMINDTFAEVETGLFEVYTHPIINHLKSLVEDGINSPAWEPRSSRPDRVSSYIYASLMVLVRVHTEISTTLSPLTASSTRAFSVPPSTTSAQLLLHETLSALLVALSQALLSSFVSRPPQRYTLPALIQATLDTEFLSQTLSQYSSPQVNDIQNDIYVELDKRTTNDARSDLQKELGVMRGVLKKLREESRVSFGCFRKDRSKDRPRGERRTTEAE